jgi:hypothetical protein
MRVSNGVAATPARRMPHELRVVAEIGRDDYEIVDEGSPGVVGQIVDLKVLGVGGTCAPSGLPRPKSWAKLNPPNP